jgi:P27 family predicted phage terminase small subunit
MGKRGPQPKPTLSNSRPNQPTGPDAPPPEVAASPHAAAVWSRVVPILKRMGVWTAADRETIGRYCQLHELHARYVAECRAGGDRIRTKTGYEALTPAATMLTKLGASLLSIEKEYGLTASARAHIAAPTFSEGEVDAEALLLREFTRPGGRPTELCRELEARGLLPSRD